MSGGPTLTPRHWAWLFAAAALVGAVLLLVAAPPLEAPEEPAACRARPPADATALSCLEGRRPDILAAELAAEPRQWACLLQRSDTPRLALDESAAHCAELHAARLRASIESFDNGLFIPLYASLSLLAVGWLAAGGRAQRAALTLAAALALSTVALVVLDRQENRRATAVLDRMEALGVASVLRPPVSFDQPELVAAAQAARRASLVKWAASALWALCLALALVPCLREGVAGLAARRRGWRLLALLPPLSLGAAGLMFAAGAGWGLAGSAIAGPAGLLEAAMAAALAGLVGAALLAAVGNLVR